VTKTKQVAETEAKPPLVGKALASASNQNIQKVFDISNTSDRKKSLKISSEF